MHRGVRECAGVAFYQNHEENAGEPHSPNRSYVLLVEFFSFKRQDAAKGLRFILKVDHILEIKEARCACPRRATLSCSGLSSRRTHNSLVLTG